MKVSRIAGHCPVETEKGLAFFGQFSVQKEDPHLLAAGHRLCFLSHQFKATELICVRLVQCRKEVTEVRLEGSLLWQDSEKFQDTDGKPMIKTANEYSVTGLAFKY